MHSNRLIKYIHEYHILLTIHGTSLHRMWTECDCVHANFFVGFYTGVVQLFHVVHILWCIWNRKYFSKYIHFYHSIVRGYISDIKYFSNYIRFHHSMPGLYRAFNELVRS